MPEMFYGGARVIERFDTLGFQSIEAPRAAVPNRSSQPEAGTDQSFALQPLQRRMNSARRDIAFEPFLDFP